MGIHIWFVSEEFFGNLIFKRLELICLHTVKYCVETYKYLGLLEVDIIKQVKMKKEKIQSEKSTSDKRENFSKANFKGEI